MIGAVEEEAATSKGARHVAKRFDGTHEAVPEACVIGEPSHWHRITLGYKGRLLLDLEARQPMAHTAGPDASIAAVVVDSVELGDGTRGDVQRGSRESVRSAESELAPFHHGNDRRT